MPQLQGWPFRSPWPQLAADDLSIIAWVTIPVQLFAVGLGSAACFQCKFNVLRWANVALILSKALALFVELLIGIFAAQGTIFDTRRRRMVAPLLALRLFLVIPDTLFTTLGTVVVFINTEDEGILCSIEVGVMALLQWASVFIGSWAIAAAIYHDLTSLFMYMLTFVLRTFGVCSSTAVDVEKLCKDMLLPGDVDIAPGDLFAAFQLVSLRQLHMRDAQEYDRDGVEPTIRRARPFSAGLRMEDDATPFSKRNPEDEKILQDFLTFFPFATAVYGRELNACARTLIPNTLIPSVTRCWNEARACLRSREARCCVDQRLAAIHELRRNLDRFNSELEILFVSGEDSMDTQPHCIVRDDGSRCVVMAIRGTFSVASAVVDIIAYPTTPDKGEGLVHSGMYRMAKNIVDMHTNTFQTIFEPGGSAHGYKFVLIGHSLGGGVAALVAMELRHRGTMAAYVEHGTTVRVLCISPPGGLLSPELAAETHQDTVSIVVGDDWVPRMSIRALEELRERCVAELCTCRHSKLGVLLMSLRRNWCKRSVISQLRNQSMCCPTPNDTTDLEERRFTDVPISVSFTPQSEAALELLQQRRSRQAGPEFWTQKLLPPGRLIHLRPRRRVRWFCGLYTEARDYEATWVKDAEDLDEIIISAKTLEHHSPHLIEWAVRDALPRMQ